MEQDRRDCFGMVFVADGDAGVSWGLNAGICSISRGDTAWAEPVLEDCQCNHISCPCLQFFHFFEGQ